MKLDYREPELDIILKQVKLLESLNLLKVDEYEHPLTGKQTMIVIKEKTVDIKSIISIDMNFYTNVILICTNSSYQNIAITQFMDDWSVIKHV